MTDEEIGIELSKSCSNLLLVAFNENLLPNVAGIKMAEWFKESLVKYPDLTIRDMINIYESVVEVLKNHKMYRRGLNFESN